MTEPFVVALDGPAASGKTTVATAAAARLGFFAFDTGVLYRALTWLALHAGVAPNDEAALVELARTWRVEVGPPTGTTSGRRTCGSTDRMSRPRSAHPR